MFYSQHTVQHMVQSVNSSYATSMVLARPDWSDKFQLITGISLCKLLGRYGIISFSFTYCAFIISQTPSSNRNWASVVYTPIRKNVCSRHHIKSKRSTCRVATSYSLCHHPFPHYPLLQPSDILRTVSLKSTVRIACKVQIKRTFFHKLLILKLLWLSTANSKQQGSN